MDPLLALTILRVWVGLLFAAHGAQKVLRWFGGDGIEGFTKVARRIGFRQPGLYARLAGFGELIGGPCLVLGLLTPVAAAWLAIVMLVAIGRIHGKNGFWNPNRGFEYPGSLFIALVALGVGGPGAWGLDDLVVWPAAPVAVFVAVLICGAIVVLAGQLGPRESAVPST